MSFSIEIPVNDPEGMKKFQDAMNEYQEAVIAHVQEVADELGVSSYQASHIINLRSRTRWSQELEDRVIACHKATRVDIVCYGDEIETMKSLGF